MHHLFELIGGEGREEESHPISVLGERFWYCRKYSPLITASSALVGRCSRELLCGGRCTQPWSISMRRFVVLALPALALTISAGAQGTQSDSTAVIAVAEGVVRAIATRDTVLARALLLPGARLLAVPDPATPTSAARMQTDVEFVQMLASGGPKYLERLWNHAVSINGSIAVVRAQYDFYRDGTFSHCGVDLFTLAKTRGEWRVSHLVYTIRRQECEPHPRGPPG